VEGLIPLGQITLFAGEPSSGKTWLGMLVGKSLANGEMFLGRSVIRCDNVIYFDRENPLSVVTERMHSIFGDQAVNYHHWGLWVHGDEPPPFGSARYEQFAMPGNVLIFDSLARFHTADENSPTEMARVFAQLRKLQALGATVIVFHHRDKKLESGYRGTAEIAAGCDVMYSLSREKQDDLRTLKLIKSRCALDSEITFRVDWDAPSIVPTENVAVMKRRNQCALISGILHGHPEGVQQVEIIRQMESHGISRAQTQRYLDSHQGSLWISNGGGRGVAKKYYERVV
jgi:hypothetical protein